jgi:hypothetical protein
MIKITRGFEKGKNIKTIFDCLTTASYKYLNNPLTVSRN